MEFTFKKIRQNFRQHWFSSARDLMSGYKKTLENKKTTIFSFQHQEFFSLRTLVHNARLFGKKTIFIKKGHSLFVQVHRSKSHCPKGF